MAFDHEFYSIANEVSSESKVKGSRFIAHACPVESREGAESCIKRLANRFHDATHNCFAYKIGVGDRADLRFSDAGEPSGTAGRPILQAIESKNLTNVAVVVTRYFGGTKLGTGGLIRAYGAVALEALNNAETVQHFPKITFRLRFDYQHANAVHNVLNRFCGQILESRFDDQTTYLVTVKSADENKVREELRDISSGKMKIEVIQERLASNE
ncbi:MAG: YigZ family protein [bacterium]